MNAEIIDLGNTHMLNVIKTIKESLNEEELSVIKTVLSLKFPQALQKLSLDNVELIELLSSPYDELKKVLINHLNILTKDDGVHLNEIAELYWEDENAFQIMHSLIEKIRRNTSSPEEIDQELRRAIWEELDTIKNTTSTRHKVPQETGIKSLDELEQIYENHEQHREFIITELKRLPEQIRFLAPDYCRNQGESSAVNLSPFRMIIRGIKLN